VKPHAAEQMGSKPIRCENAADCFDDNLVMITESKKKWIKCQFTRYHFRQPSNVNTEHFLFFDDAFNIVYNHLLLFLIRCHHVLCTNAQ